MSKYVVNFTNKNKTPIIIEDDHVDTSTDLMLLGRAKIHYGADLNQSLLSLLQKFSCPEDTSNPGFPNTVLSQGKLINPIVGQIWYNSTQQAPYIWNGSYWENIFSEASMSTNWGIISDGQQIPQPMDSEGNTFNYTECVWIVSPFTINGELEAYTLETNINAVVTYTITPIGGAPITGASNLVNYLIIGIKNNVNNGALSPVITPSPTPTTSVTPSVTPIGVNLSSGLVSFWEFEENGSSTFFTDSRGINPFTRNGVATTIAGKVNNAIQPATNTYLVVSPNTSGMVTGNNAGYTFGGWFKGFNGVNSYAPIFQRGIIGEAQNRSFHLVYTFQTDNLTLSKSNNGITLESVNTPGLGIHDNNWHFIVAWVDGAHLTINIQVDNGSIYSNNLTYSATYNIGNLQLGSSSGIPLQTGVDQLFYYNRVLNFQERSALYNANAGVTYAYVSGLLPPSPTPSITPTLTPSRTPGVLPLSVSIVGTHIASGSGPESNTVTTNSITAVASNGVVPYTYEWIYLVPTETQPTGEAATINSPSSSFTSFTRLEPAGIYNGYFRLKVTDGIGDVAYSTPILVQTTHT